MRPDPRFLGKSKAFWASVRSLSQKLRYSKGDHILVPTAETMAAAFIELDLDPKKILANGRPTRLALDLILYFQARSEALENSVQHNLMNAEQAEALYEETFDRLRPNRPVTMNKQSGDKKKIAYLTAIVNMIVEHHKGEEDCDLDPRKLTTVTRDGEPLRTLARRVDGAFPSSVNPIAIWEIKEYYYTTTFGSRVADGVYETLLDGIELEELREHERIDVKHYLMVDAHYTWWECGKSYLCRIYDMLHMGYVDEVLFGREVVVELPRIVEEWRALSARRGEAGLPEDRG